MVFIHKLVVQTYYLATIHHGPIKSVLLAETVSSSHACYSVGPSYHCLSQFAHLIALEVRVII